jgi:pheromone shutdown-related protein TraB
MQAQMGRETGVAPGSEMLRAIQVGTEMGAEVVLIDRDVSITLKRGFGSMGFWARARLFWKVWMDVLTPTKQMPPSLEEMLKTDAITKMTEDFARFAPAIKTALIDERDDYMASHIREQVHLGGPVVAVVGAGHVPGLRLRLEGGSAVVPRVQLDQLPPPRVTAGKVLAWAIPLLLVAGFVYVGYTADWTDLRDELVFYVLMTGGFAALGVVLAFGHPWSVLTAFVAAPITVLHPLLAAGWFAGLAEAKVRTPTVADFQAIKHIETMRGFWRNGVVRILLVTALANLGAVVGSGVVGVRLFQLFFGGN